MKSIYLHPHLGEIVLSSTRRSVRISLTVRPSGEVRLSFPPYISQKKALAFLESKIEWVEKSRQKYSTNRKPYIYTSEQIEALRTEAKAFLPKRTEELAAKFNIKYNKVTIRATRSKWGSCTRQGNISLSLFLMTLPEHLRNYVILHELCHIIHFNHSPNFHALLDILTQGQEKALARELRNYSIGL